MSIDPEYDRVITLEPLPNGHEPVPSEAPIATELAPAPPAPAPVAAAPKAVRRRPRWVVPAAIAAVGLIASGTLGYLFYSTNQKLNVTTQHLVATQTSLNSTKLQLSNLQQDAADKKAIADYVSMYTVDSGKVRTDYGQIIACNSFSTCRTSAQQALNDMQAFQSDRQSATVPSALTASDGQLGDSLSAGIAAVQELISGMDTDNVKKIDDGFSKINDSMLSLAKAESALGAELR
jgi:hypothetical protein